VGVAGERRKQEAVRQQSRSDLQRGSAFFKDFGGGVQFLVFGFQFSVFSSQWRQVVYFADSREASRCGALGEF
jgi:hypothetical protein